MLVKNINVTVLLKKQKKMRKAERTQKKSEKSLKSRKDGSTVLFIILKNDV
jgi:hypothetical protein